MAIGNQQKMGPKIAGNISDPTSSPENLCSIALAHTVHFAEHFTVENNETNFI